MQPVMLFRRQHRYGVLPQMMGSMHKTFMTGVISEYPMEGLLILMAREAG